jgi:hypothetical protein
MQGKHLKTLFYAVGMQYCFVFGVPTTEVNQILVVGRLSFLISASYQ